jgi:hypothetical protein
MCESAFRVINSVLVMAALNPTPLHFQELHLDPAARNGQNPMKQPQGAAKQNTQLRVACHLANSNINNT